MKVDDKDDYKKLSNQKNFNIKELLFDKLKLFNIPIIDRKNITLDDNVNLNDLLQIKNTTNCSYNGKLDNLNQKIDVTIKFIPIEIDDNDFLDDFVSEIKNMSEISKKDIKSIQRFLGILNDSSNLVFIYENFNGISLAQLLNPKIEEYNYMIKLNIFQRIMITFKIIDAVKTLHNNKIAHCDMRPDLIYLSDLENDDSNRLKESKLSNEKLIVNGENNKHKELYNEIVNNLTNDSESLRVYFSNVSENTIHSKTMTFTTAEMYSSLYKSPEFFDISNLLNDDKINSNKSEFNLNDINISNEFHKDIWSLGLIISEIFSGVKPWKNKFKKFTEIEKCLCLKKKFPIPPLVLINTDSLFNFSGNILEESELNMIKIKIETLIAKCTNTNYEERIKIDEIHEYFLSIVNNYLS